MRLFLVVILLLSAHSAAARQGGSSSTTKHQVVTDFGQLAAICEKGSCRFRLGDLNIEADGKPLRCHFSGPANQVMSSLRFWSGKEDYLISEHQGAGCPVHYRILRVLAADRYLLSKPFGNCNGIEMMGTAGVKFVEFYLPPSSKVHREGAKFLWNLDSSDIYQQVRP